MIIIKCANHNDAEAILDLQKSAYTSQAEIYNDYNIPPLTQTLDEIKNDIREQNFLKALEEDSNTNIVKIVGSVRAYAKDNTAFIGRLMVEPKLQNRGIGTLLMKAIEQQFAPPEVTRYELFTGHRSIRNLYLYRKLGYREFKRIPVSGTVTMVFMEKRILFNATPVRDKDNKRTNPQGNRIVQKFSQLNLSSDRVVLSQPPPLQQYSSTSLSSKRTNKKKEQRSLLICYATAGYPDTQTTKEIVSTMISAGADIIEIGIPFSDPIADGPIIQEASFVALSKGMTPNKSLQIVKDIRSKFSEIPIILMTYSNILVKAGVGDFIRKAGQSGADGFILPDMPIEESSDYINEATRWNLATIFLASPNTEEGRLREIASKSRGFLYLISTYGTTGIRSSFDPSTANYIRNVKRIVGSSLPIAIGFGISKPEHAKFMIDAGADAIIVASAITNIIRLHTLNERKKKKNNTQDKRMRDMLMEISDFVSAMRSACMTY
jgi:tryptophan synthase alpha chain